MIFPLFRFTLFSIMVCLTLPLTVIAQVVDIPDSKLRTEIEKALGKASGATITTNGMVRLVYFLPSDRPHRPDRVAALRQSIKETQQFYADEMQRHGFGRKTFSVETDENGEPVVHHIEGKFTEEYYHNSNADHTVWIEILEHFDDSDFQHIYFTVIDLSYEHLRGACGLGGVSFHPVAGSLAFDPTRRFYLRGRDITTGEEVLGGFAIIPASGDCFEDPNEHKLRVIVHELGHALGLPHDFRKGKGSDYVMAAAKSNRLSKCAAEWLSVNRFFNTKSTFRNEPGEIRLLSLQSYSQDVINFRFEVTDPDGLHQAQLLVPEIIAGAYIWGTSMLFDCKRLSGKTGTVEFAVRTAELAGRIGLQIIDVGGNITWAFLPIELDEVEPVQNALDVNGDDVVNLSDLVSLASRFGQRGKSKADVNEDGVVDIVDVLLVVPFISSLPRQTVEMLASADVQQWLTDARSLDVENEIMVKGIFALEHLFTEIALLSQPMAHNNSVWSVAFSPDGQMLASASWDKTVRLWDVDAEQLLYTLIGPTYYVNSVAFSPDGGTLASAAWDATIRLWNPHTAQLKRTLKQRGGVLSVIFSPDGELLASGGDYQTLLLWDTTTWQVKRKLTGHTGLVGVVVFSPDGGILASGSRDNTIRLWNPHTGQHIRTLPATSPVNRLAFSPDGDTLASGSWDKTIRLWNPHTGKLKRTLPNQGGWVNAVAFSSDGDTLVIGNRGISLWDLETGQDKEPLAEDIGDAVSVAFSPDGTMLASGSGDGKVRLWDFTPFLITPGLSKVSGDNQTGVSGTVLSNPFVIKVRDANLSVRKGIPVTFTVIAGDGTLSVTHTTTDENGRAESTLTLGQNPGTNTVSVSAAGIEGTVTFNATVEAAVDIPDPNLRAAVETALNKAKGDLITLSEMEALTRLDARNANISDLTGLEYATNLTYLNLSGDHVEGRYINSNSVSNLSPLSGLTNLTELYLDKNIISDISAVEGLTHLKSLGLGGNSITDISSVVGLTNLTRLWLWENAISDISAIAGLTHLKVLDLDRNAISDISAVVGLTNLTFLDIWGTSISDISPVAGLTNLTTLGLGENNISDISPVAGLTNLTQLWLLRNSISDISPLIANTGLGSGDKVVLNNNPLSYSAINTHIPVLQNRGVTVEFDNRPHPALLKISGDNQNGASFVSLPQPFVVEAQDANGFALAGVAVKFTVTGGGGTLSTQSTMTDANGRAQSTLILGPTLGINTVEVSATGIENTAIFYGISDTAPTEFLLSIPSGISLIHVPLKTAVDNVPKTIGSIADLYDALGGASKVNFLITYDSQIQGWLSYFSASDRDRELTDDMGIIAGMKAATSISLSGSPLGTNGTSIITLNPGLNVVGLPLRDSRINRVSDLFTLQGIGGNVPIIILTDGGEFKAVGRADDPGDIAITGGQSFILNAQRAARVDISGRGWYNSAPTTAAPPMVLSGIQVTDTTPVLALRGLIVDEGPGVNKASLRVRVKNLSTDRAITTVIGAEKIGYQLTVVDVETGRAAKIGDILEISAQSPNPFIGVEPVQYAVTAEDVKRSYIQLPALVAYEIPAETELLANYPNPFNPETWIPYRLAEDADVNMTIYNGSGQAVRTLDVGHRIASAYESRSKAIYWDGKNEFGETVASGVYFYHLTAGDYSATRKMLILK